MTDNYSMTGVGMTMTRINAEGEVEPIKDRKVERRVEMIINGDVVALTKLRDQCKQEADAMKAKLEAESKIYQERKACRKGKYSIKNPVMLSMFEMVAAYDRTIEQMIGVR